MNDATGSAEAVLAALLKTRAEAHRAGFRGLEKQLRAETEP